MLVLIRRGMMTEKREERILSKTIDRYVKYVKPIYQDQVMSR